MAIFDVPIVWGAVRLWTSYGDVDVSRTLVAHELAQGDAHPLHDAGLGPRPLRLSLMFDSFAGDSEDGEARLQRLLAQHRSGKAYMLSHPIEGNFLAKIGAFRYGHDEDSVLTADVTFLPEESDEAVSPAGAGVPAIAGEAAVTSAADELDGVVVGFDEELIAAAGSISEKAAAAVESWSAAEEVPTRQVMADVAEISTSISAMITDYELEEDLALFDVWLALIKLGEAVRSAAQAATAEVPSTFTARLSEPVVLLALCAQIYGGRMAETRERQVRELNDLRSTAWVGPGELVMPSRSL